VKGYRLPTQWIAEGSIVVNVASYKNIDEDMLLKIKDVQYVSMVGKVTVAMLERNLVRLFENYHHPDLRKEKVTYVSSTNEIVNPWYDSPIQLYTALAITALLAVTLTRNS